MFPRYTHPQGRLQSQGKPRQQSLPPVKHSKAQAPRGLGFGKTVGSINPLSPRRLWRVATSAPALFVRVHRGGTPSQSTVEMEKQRGWGDGGGGERGSLTVSSPASGVTVTSSAPRSAPPGETEEKRRTSGHSHTKAHRTYQRSRFYNNPTTPSRSSIEPIPGRGQLLNCPETCLGVAKLPSYL